jgi:hypothetical protein
VAPHSGPIVEINRPLMASSGEGVGFFQDKALDILSTRSRSVPNRESVTESNTFWILVGFGLYFHSLNILLKRRNKIVSH